MSHSDQLKNSYPKLTKLSINLKKQTLWTKLIKFQILTSQQYKVIKNSKSNFSKSKLFKLGIFILPIVYFGKLWTTNSVTFSILQNNFPAVFLPIHKISWETFQKSNYFYLSTLHLDLNNDKIKRNHLVQKIVQNSIFQVDLWNEFLTFQLGNKWLSYRKQYFLGIGFQDTIKNSLGNKFRIYYSRENQNSNYYLCFQEQKNYPIYYTIDEFPFKLKNIYSQDDRIRAQLNFSQKQNKSLENNLSQTQIFDSYKLSIDRTLPPPDKTSFIGIENHQYRGNNVFQLSLNQLQKRNLTDNFKFSVIQDNLTKIFYNYGYTISEIRDLDKKSFSTLLDKKFAITAAHQIVDFISEIESNKKDIVLDRVILNQSSFQVKTFNFPRFMSGFIYPDVSTENVFNSIAQKNYYIKLKTFIQKFSSISLKSIWDSVNLEFIQIHVGPMFSLPNFYFNQKPEPVRLQLKYYPIKFESDGIVNYMGPGIQLKQKSTIDSLNWFKVRQNLKFIFNPDDPRQSHHLKFFIKDQKEINSISTLFEKTKIKQFSPLENREISSERELPVGNKRNFEVQYEIPFLNFQQFSNWLKLRTEGEKSPLIQSFPIREISYLTTNEFEALYDPLDYQNPKKSFWYFVNLGLPSSKVNIHFPPTMESAFSANFVNFINITYQKKSNQYLEADTKIFGNDSNSIKSSQLITNQLWEPIHQYSWLVISQYIFVIFVVYLLRQLAISYGRELVAYLLDLFSSLGIVDASLKEELTEETSLFQIIRNPKVTFKSIGGMDSMFLKVFPIILFLRKSKKFLDKSRKVPQGVLLTGPPGTGKTLLVKAIANEAKVPIFMQGASTLNTGDSLGSYRLKTLFERARESSPSLIFFDEIDSIGQKRSEIIKGPMEESLFHLLLQLTTTSSVKPTISDNYPLFKKKRLENDDEIASQMVKDNEQLSILMQLLIELDGLEAQKRIMVIGATNRYEVLDPALLRPGRLERQIKIGLPDKTKRIEICQIYSKTLGVEQYIHWDHIGNKTFGFSGAALAAAMNQSSVQAICNDSKHTLLTIENAINKIIAKPTNRFIERSATNIWKSQEWSHQQMILRFAYYYAGWTLMRLVLSDLTTPPSCSLFPVELNERYQNIIEDIFSVKIKRLTLSQLKTQLLEFYSGKISEIMYLQTNLFNCHNDLNYSNLGFENDIYKASEIIFLLIDRWYLASHKLAQVKLCDFVKNQNNNEFIQLEGIIQKSIHQNEGQFKEDQYRRSLELSRYYSFQFWKKKAWAQIRVCNEYDSKSTSYSNWYRLYLKNPTESIINDEWLQPDFYYHQNEIFYLSKTLNFNSTFVDKKDVLYQKILKSILNEGIFIISQCSDFIDLFVSYLITYHYIRDFEIDELANQFFAFSVDE